MAKNTKKKKRIEALVGFSLKSKLFLLTMIPILIVLAIISILTIQNNIEIERELISNRIESYVILLETGDLSFESIKQKDKLEKYFNENVLLSRLIKRDGTIAYTSGLAHPQSSRIEEYINQSLKGFQITYTSQQELPIFVSLSPIIVKNSIVGVLHMEFSFEKSNNRINQYMRFILLLNVLGLVTLYFLITLFSKKIILNRIERLTKTSSEICEGHLDIVIENSLKKSRDEIGILAQTFDIMRQQIKRSHDELENKVRERTAKLEQAYYKLKGLDKQKDLFISIAAHELKTPLTTIRGFTQILQDQDQALDSKQRAGYLNLIIKNSQRLYDLILDLIDSTRLSLGKINIDLGTIDVGDTFREIKESVEIILKEKEIKLKFNLEKGIPKIMADPQRVMQVLRNLIINAVHATAQGGTISLTARRKGNLVQFEVKDTGIGISKHDQKYLFTKFYQADDSHRKKFTGSGLGLSICKGMVELMNGKIWFESKPGKGTTFYFTLPIVHKIKKEKR
ncbi:MAG: ATP-binding protein [Nanoarchaeota archaeon]|nr:ATP-binding protein [Nanoarchaeota archaeon]